MGISTAIMMSGSGSNARKIIENNSEALDIKVMMSENPRSNYLEIAAENNIQHFLNDIYSICGVEHDLNNLTENDRKKLRNKDERKRLDRITADFFEEFGIELVAAAGYDWVMTEQLCEKYIIVNVHPGDLRVKRKNGKPRYAGLGWIPTAKAILNGEKFAYTSTHIITPGLDEGPIAMISDPVAINLPAEFNKDNILPEDVTLKTIINDINYNSGNIYGDALIYTHSIIVQNKLKEKGDWIIFPETLEEIARYMQNGRFTRDPSGILLLDNAPIQDLFLMKSV